MRKYMSKAKNFLVIGFIFCLSACGNSKDKVDSFEDLVNMKVFDVLVIRVHDNENVISQTRIHKVFEQMNAQYQNANINVHFNIIRIRNVPDPFPRLNHLDQRLEKFHKIKTYTSRRGWAKSKRWITYWIIPGAHKDGKTWSYGYASGTCRVNRYPIMLGTGQIRDEPKANGRFYYEVIAEHETGHVIGAKHFNDVPNIMHEAALSKMDYDLKFEPESKAEIEACL
jgi:hypothetical protein